MKLRLRLLVRHRLKRLIRRIIHAFRSEWCTWEYESCNRCGACYRLPYIVDDRVWMRIVGTENGCYCIDCLINTAEEKGVKFSATDFKLMWPFSRNVKGSFEGLSIRRGLDGKPLDT